MNTADVPSPGPDGDDHTDFADATRGLVDRFESCVIRNSRGRVIWDNDRWGFLEQDCPETVHPNLWRIGQLNAHQGLFEVVPGIYQARGLDGSNMTLVEGDTGVVAIDPLCSKETAAAAMELYHRNRGDRPVRAVVYTHSHGDHFGGVHGVTDPRTVAAGECEIVAPAEFMEHAVSENIFAGPAVRRRAVYMYGATLPASPRGMVGFGLAQAMSRGTFGLIPPTATVEATGQELTLDGVRFVFQLTPDTEAPSEMNLALPDHQVLLIAENVTHTLHNVLTLRGALVRDAHAWASSITESLQLFDDAEVLIGSHHWPTWGRDNVRRILTEQRDAYAYLHDQTVRLMNRGLTGAEIAEELTEFPAELARSWSVRGYYGSLSHNVKAVYQRYMGWFDGNPAHLWQHPPVERAKRYVAYMGGTDAVLAKARISAEEGDLRWVAEVLNHVVFAEPSNTEARELLATTYERLGYAQENGTWRNFYLTGAKELRAPYDRPPVRPGLTLGSIDMIAALTTRQVFQSLAVCVDGPRAAAHRLLMRWEFSDTGEVWTLLLGNGVLTPLRGDAPGGEKPRLTLGLERPGLDRILAGRTSFTDAVAAGAIELDGDAGTLATFQDLLEQPSATFPIVLP
ncbi:alkyl/aryl-sulfatase [Streptomyces albipurpureus]|uniref:MBL fold metallo-hydrolase n=1 Tax=Streptomyces albipurpureus TaxID=2897419 RepID=A0ABT0UY77_9ACTN|nr:alkyl sulfatase dimerization domain-containing protein [Streptomyces sp. CWNU-1]MCM2393528.1 MBL fold metallo-hydrolase [Streptomyces sp. CWNU-1]